MMMQFFRNRAARTLAPNEANIGDRLPYAGHLDDVTIKTRDGLLVQTLHLRGFPFETSSDDELNYRKAMRETLLRGVASSRLAIYHHVVRRKVATEFDAAPDNIFCRRLDDAWRARLARRQLYVNEIFLTLVRRPLQGSAGLLERLIRKPGEDAALLERELRQLHATRETFLATLAPYGPRTLSLYKGPTGLCSEPAEFLSLLTNGSACWPRRAIWGNRWRRAVSASAMRRWSSARPAASGPTTAP
jgi:type IV secretion system protein VirB4